METTRITVWDYLNHLQTEKAPPVKYEVDAWCVQGETGFIAFFYMPDVDENMVYQAHGDDGHWWMVNKFHKHWLPEFKHVVESIEER